MSKEGWAYLHNSRVEHYFVAGRSLCGRWLCFSMDFHTTMGQPECKACRKALDKREERGSGMRVLNSLEARIRKYAKEKQSEDL